MILTRQDWRLYIGGDWASSTSEAEVRLPYDGTLIGRTFNARAQHIRRALDIAHNVLYQRVYWTPKRYAKAFSELHDVIRERRDEFRDTICLETGKPLREAHAEVDQALDALRAIASEVESSAATATLQWYNTSLQTREARGVIAVMAPFPTPLLTAIEEIIPALAGGNSVVYAPARQTPFTPMLLAHAFDETSYERGTVSIVYGPEVVTMLTSEPGIDLRVTPSVGGRLAYVIEPDADLDYAARSAAERMTLHSGQGECPLQEIHVQQEIRKPFARALAEQLGRFNISHPFEQSCVLSSLVSEQAALEIETWIDTARQHGARITGGRRHGPSILPAMVENCPDPCRHDRNELRGPVVTLVPYESFERLRNFIDARRVAIFTRDVQQALQSARLIHAEAVSINTEPVSPLTPRHRIDRSTITKRIDWHHLEWKE